MSKYKSPFRFVVAGLAVVAISTMTLAANWGGQFGIFSFADSSEVPTGVRLDNEPNGGGCGGSVLVTSSLPSGPSSYATLGAAFTDINNGIHKGSISISVCTDTIETVTAVLNESGSGSASYTALTVQPVGGGARVISGSIVGPLIDLNGADNVTISGVNTGGNSLTISNTAVGAASTIRFANDASNNTVTKTTLKGSGTTSFGVVYFGGGVTTGNDNNNINNCIVTPAGTNLPLNGVFSAGTSASVDNSGETIDSNTISDFFNDTNTSAAVAVTTNNSGWTISNNKIFQSSSRTYVAATTHNGISVASGSGYTITGNTIGYSAANATGTYSMLGTVATRFVGINLAVGTTAATSVQGNTIASISLATSSGASTANGVLCGLNITSGNVNVGNVTPNTFGSTTGTGSLVATPTTSQGAVVGINAGSTGTVVISNNTFGGFTSSSPTATIGGAVFGVIVSAVATSITITGNTIGNSTADNMKAGILGTTTAGSLGGGINQAAAIPLVSNYSNNTIRNISSYGTGNGYVRGIQTGTASSATATSTINGNTITNLTTSGAVTGQTSANTAAQGIQFLPGNNSSISGNTISNIAGLNAGTGGIVVAGIVHASATNTVISNNKISALSNASTSVSATLPNVLAGILIRSGTSSLTVANNMITLGTGQATNSSVYGIWANHGSTPDPGLDMIYFNTVNVEGTVTTGAAPTAAFHRGDLTATTKNVPVDVRNNIFTNSRSGGTGKHYAIANHIGAAVSSSTGWGSGASNNNVINSNAGTVGFWTTDKTFSGWRMASASDGSSFSGIAVNYVNSASDLHLNMGSVTRTYIESGAVALAGFTTDIDGQTRPGPAGSLNGGAINPDIGADEFDGVPPVANDIAPVAFVVPTSSFMVPSGSPLSPQASFVNLGIIAQTNVNVRFTMNGPGGYTYTDDKVIASILPTQVVTVTFTAAPALPTGAFTMTVSVQTPDSDAANDIINGTFNALPPLTGRYNVGSSGAYASLTNPGGIFESLNALGATGKVTINITSDLSGETGAVPLNESSGGYTVTIKPSGAPHTISGSAGTPAGGALIKLNGADGVTIDGSLNGGTDRSLTISNSGTGAIIWVATNAASGANNNVIKNCVLSGGGPTVGTQGVIAGSGATYGSAAENGRANSNNTLQNNAIKGVQNALFALGDSTTLDQNWVITGNDAGSTVVAEKLSFRGFAVQNAQNFQITRNHISGISSSTASSSTMSGILIGSTLSGGLIDRNEIKDIRQNNTAGWGSNGIQISSASTLSNVTISNNFISDIASFGFNAVTSQDNGYGIMINSGASFKIYNNTVSMNTNQTAAGSITAAVNIATAVTGVGGIDLRGNILSNSQTVGTRYAVYNSSASNVFSTINFNDYFAQNVGFVVSAQATLANWQTATGQDANSKSVDPLFVSATDLHLKTVSTLIDQAVSLAGITADYDGQIRPVGSANDIGADEWVPAVTVSGRVITSGGQGIRNVIVTLTDNVTSAQMSVVTGSFGFYSFPNIPTSGAVTVSVNAKRFTFTPSSHVFALAAERPNEDFVANPLP